MYVCLCAYVYVCVCVCLLHFYLVTSVDQHYFFHPFIIYLSVLKLHTTTYNPTLPFTSQFIYIISQITFFTSTSHNLFLLTLLPYFSSRVRVLVLMAITAPLNSMPYPVPVVTSAPEWVMLPQQNVFLGHLIHHKEKQIVLYVLWVSRECERGN